MGADDPIGDEETEPEALPASLPASFEYVRQILATNSRSSVGNFEPLPVAIFRSAQRDAPAPRRERKRIAAEVREHLEDARAIAHEHSVGSVDFDRDPFGARQRRELV